MNMTWSALPHDRWKAVQVQHVDYPVMRGWFMAVSTGYRDALLLMTPDPATAVMPAGLALVGGTGRQMVFDLPSERHGPRTPIIQLTAQDDVVYLGEPEDAFAWSEAPLWAEIPSARHSIDHKDQATLLLKAYAALGQSSWDRHSWRVDDFRQGLACMGSAFPTDDPAVVDAFLKAWPEEPTGSRNTLALFEACRLAQVLSETPSAPTAGRRPRL